MARTPLRIPGGPSPILDLPGHVRAGSGLARVGARWVVAQDDTLALALVPVDRPGAAQLLPLTPAEDGRRQFSASAGNKALKPDLEACVVVDGTLWAFGSGSTARRRSVLVADGLGSARRPAPRMVELQRFYQDLAARPDFAGSEMNLEGAAALGPWLYLANRGNGAPRGDLRPVDAVARVDLEAFRRHLSAPGAHPAPALDRVEAVDLGHLGGVRLTFTDLAAGPGGALWFLAAAEASPDTYQDGPVEGVALGHLRADGSATWVQVLDEGGRPFLDKAEGLAFDPTRPGRAWVVTDTDDPTRPAELCEVEVSGETEAGREAAVRSSR